MKYDLSNYVEYIKKNYNDKKIDCSFDEEYKHDFGKDFDKLYKDIFKKIDKLNDKIIFDDSNNKSWSQSLKKQFYSASTPTFIPVKPTTANQFAALIEPDATEVQSRILQIANDKHKAEEVIIGEFDSQTMSFTNVEFASGADASIFDTHFVIVKVRYENYSGTGAITACVEKSSQFVWFISVPKEVRIMCKLAGEQQININLFGNIFCSLYKLYERLSFIKQIGKNVKETLENINKCINLLKGYGYIA